MNNRVEELPEQMILNITWKQPQAYDFFHSLIKGSIFGYSLAFTYNEVVELAESYGIKVKLLPISHPLRKKYNYYVLKVVSINGVTPLKCNPIMRVSFEDIHYYTLSTAKGNRICHGHDCRNQILKGSKCLEIVDLIELPSGKKAYDKKSYCAKCADHILTNKVKALTALRKSLLSKKY